MKKREERGEGEKGRRGEGRRGDGEKGEGEKGRWGDGETGREVVKEVRIFSMMLCYLPKLFTIEQEDLDLMNSGIRVARIWGIPIRLHISWFLIFVLITWSLAIGTFPQEYPGLPRLSLWLLSGLTSLLFAASVLMHELGHSFVALRDGIPVRSITLFFFGGMAQISREPASASSEFRVAIAGPLISLGLAAVFGVLSLPGQAFPALAAPCAWLAYINLMLGLFNLIPGFPLDGGRVLRAGIWKLTGDALRATRIAAIIGRVIAFGFIVIGIYAIATHQPVNGIWLLLIGWFLQSSASGVYSQASLYHTLRGMNVSQIMGPKPNLVPADMTLDRLVSERVMGAGELSFQIDGGGQNTILTLSEIKAIPRRNWPSVTVRQAIARQARNVAVGPEMDLVEAIMHMEDQRATQAPVMEGGVVLGLLTREQVWNYVRENRL